MAEHHSHHRYSGPSRPSRAPATVYPTRARRKRMGLLIVVLACVGLVLVVGAGALVWYVASLAGESQEAGVAGGVTTTVDPGAVGGAGSEAQAVATTVDYELKPLIDLVSFRDLAYMPVKAVHVYSVKAADKASMGRIMDIIDRTELNAMVVAVKDDNGRIAYNSLAPMAVEYNTVNPIIWGGDLDALVATLAGRNIIPIARLVCFKDDGLTSARPDLAIQNKDTGQPWVDRNGSRYLNPYNHEVWEYIVQVAEDVAKRGFREIQFDYVRFPAGADGDLSKVSYPGKYCTKEEAIAGFLAYARPRLEPLGVWVSADVFGYVVDVAGDMGIGQNMERMCMNLDLICPMVYPNLYEFGAYGIQYPPAEPYNLVKNALAKAPGRLIGLGTKCRPWLQAHDDYFTRGVEYTADLIKEEIRAASELGFDEYLLWGGYPDLGAG